MTSWWWVEAKGIYSMSVRCFILLLHPSSPVCADSPAPPPGSAGSAASRSALPELPSEPRCSPSPHSASSPAGKEVFSVTFCVTLRGPFNIITVIHTRYYSPHLLAIPLLRLFLVPLHNALILGTQLEQNGAQLGPGGRVHLHVHLISGNTRLHLLEFL